MLQHVLYAASEEQIELFKKDLKPKDVRSKTDKKDPEFESVLVSPPDVKGLQFHITLVSEIDNVAIHLRRNPVDLLVFDERNKGAEAITALTWIKEDVRSLADLWGPDFLFPMSRSLVILEKMKSNENRIFKLGRLNVVDVKVAPDSTDDILASIAEILGQRHTQAKKVGVALSGGGVEGFLFQLGVVHALSQALDGKSLSAAHIFTGVSSGSIIAALLAAEVSIEDVIAALHGKSEKIPPLTSSTLYDLASLDIASRMIGSPLDWVAIDPEKIIRKALKTIPTGFFKGERLTEYFKKTITLGGLEDDFGKLGHELYVGATDQDSFEHVIFGRPPWDKIPISEALRASCALPPFFIPAQIQGRWFVDGQVTRSCNIELAVERGCRLVIIVDPLKPLSTLVPGSVDKQGGVYSMIQMIKALVYTRFESELKHITERFPDVDFIVFQPDDESAALMAGSPMRYKFRTQLIKLAFKGTLRRLRERHHVYSVKFGKYGFKLRPAGDLLALEQPKENDQE